MTPDWVVFLVGAFVTVIWGTMVGALLSAGGKSGNRSNEGSSVEQQSDRRGPKASNV